MVDGTLPMYYSISTHFSAALGPEGNSNFMSAIALLDLISNTTTYQSMVVEGVNTIVGLNIAAALQP